MGLFGGVSPAESLCESLKKREKFVEFDSVRGMASLVSAAYKLEPRLIGCVSGWNGKVQLPAGFSFKRTCQVEIEYTPGIPDDYRDVIIDDGNWKPSDILKSGNDMPLCFHVITRDLGGVRTRFQNDMDYITQVYPGTDGVKYNWYSDKSYDGYSYLQAEVSLPVDQQKYKQWEILAKREIERIDRTCLGRSNRGIPSFVKAYLVFSYIQQECKYDNESADLITAKGDVKLERPYVVLPYGPLCKKMGICSGISTAYKAFMDYYGIECRIVSGTLDDVEHLWNIVKLNDKYYHVDCTYGMDGDGIYIGKFLRSDSEMSETHYWDMSRYPECRSYSVDYDFVEEYVAEHYDALLRYDIDQKYLSPCDVRE